jgi:hypothetical protein
MFYRFCNLCVSNYCYGFQIAFHRFFELETLAKSDDLCDLYDFWNLGDIGVTRWLNFITQLFWLIH